jgi:glycolate oxidase
MGFHPEPLKEELQRLLSEEQVVAGPSYFRAYDCDAYTVRKRFPDVVVFPKSTEEVQRVVRWCVAQGIPYTPRGAGTGLSGGATPAVGGVLLVFTRMRRILEVDAENRVARVEVGCPNLSISKAVADWGLHFAPDPSSQAVCTLGGNIGENSGGPHTLKYGVTTDHVLGLRVVDSEGEVRDIGGKAGLPPGLDLLGLLVGSEGTLAVVTEAWVRLVPLPKAVRTLLASFPTPRDASETVSEVIRQGIIPSAMEFMDGHVIEAVVKAFGVDLPMDAGALLLVECDSYPDEDWSEEEARSVVEEEIALVQEIARSHRASSLRVAQDEGERSQLWLARKRGIGALGRLAPSLVTHDGVIPRSRLPEVLDFVYEVARARGLRVANIFHAGDGNLHPIFLFDERDPKQVEAVVEAGEEVMRRCIAEGGSVTGEHGVGIEKIDLLGEMYSPEDLSWQERVREVFNPYGLCNPGKVLPSQKSCVEVRLRHKGVST